MPTDESDRTDSPVTPPERTPGLEPGGGVAPGDTPPAADSMSGATLDHERTTPNQGPVSGNRTPMIITLAILGLMVLAVVGYGIAEISTYLGKKPVSNSGLGVSAPLLR